MATNPIAPVPIELLEAVPVPQWLSDEQIDLRRLLCAVIGQAVADLAIPLGRLSIGRRDIDRGVKSHSAREAAAYDSACEYLFGTNSTFGEMAQTLGLDPEAIREKLMERVLSGNMARVDREITPNVRSGAKAQRQRDRMRRLREKRQKARAESPL